MAHKNELTEMDIDLAPALMKKGSNTAIVATVVATREIAKHADINNPDTLMDCLQQYIYFCLENNMKITNMAAYAACGVSGTDIQNWEKGRTRKNDPRYREFATFLRSVCSQFREQSMVEGTLNPVVGIWHQKQYDGFQDNPVVEVGPDNGLELKQDPDEIAEKYRDILAVSDETEEGE